MTIIKPPEYPFNHRDPLTLTIFLAGTIEMGESEDWQTEIALKLQNYLPFNHTVLNPRRDEWDSTVEQKFENPKFFQQVNWELDGLDQSDVIIMNLLKDSKSPVSLLELGLYADSKKMYVCCEEGFWRRGNVEIVCSRYGIPLFDNMTDLLLYASVDLSKKH